MKKGINEKPVLEKNELFLSAGKRKARENYFLPE